MTRLVTRVFTPSTVVTRGRHGRLVRLGAAVAFLGSLPACKDDPVPVAEQPRQYATTEYTMPESAPDQTPIRFTDVTASARITFTHHTGAFGQKWMPETIGAGGGFLDYNGDSHPDILLVNGADWPGHEQTAPPPTPALFRNNADGSFTDVTIETGLNVSLYGMGCAFADYDADGDIDIYITAVGDNRLFQNDSGRFTDVTAHAGVTGNDPAPDAPPSWSTSATFFDYDRDGWLDLLVANYVKWTPQTDIYTTLDGKNKSYATPVHYNGQSCRLYRNNANGAFSDVTHQTNLLNDNGKSLGLAIADFNNDHWPDIFITNDTQPNFLYLNHAGASFENIAMMAGCGYDESGRARAGMGVDVTDVTNDGLYSVAIGNFSGEPLSLYTQIGEGLYQDTAGKTRLSRPTLACLTFGVLFADFDLDGFADLFLANGHIEPEINTVQKEVTFAQRPELFRNNQQGQFIDVSDDAGPALAEPVVGRALASADFDLDGDLDVLLTTNGGPPKLLRNETISPSSAPRPNLTEPRPSGSGLPSAPRLPLSEPRLLNAQREGSGPPAAPPTPNWIKLILKGKHPNHAAIGAQVIAAAGDLTQRRMVRSAGGYLSQSDTTILLGIGQHAQLDSLTIHWPDGSSQSITTPLPANTTHTLTSH